METEIRNKIIEELKKNGIVEDAIDDDLMSMLTDIMDDMREAMDMMRDRGMDDIQANEAMKKIAQLMIERDRYEIETTGS